MSRSPEPCSVIDERPIGGGADHVLILLACSLLATCTAVTSAAYRPKFGLSRSWTRWYHDDIRRSARKLTEPDLGVLAARLLLGLTRELVRRTAEAGFDDLRPRHGAVLAYLDEDGVRLADLARLAGRNKQTIAAIVDELENLGYVSRADDPADRRAKLILPTERGRRRMRLGDEIVADIERRHEAKLGRAAYANFIRTLREITADEESVEE